MCRTFLHLTLKAVGLQENDTFAVVDQNHSEVREL